MSNAISPPLAQAKAVLLHLIETIPTLTSASLMYNSARIISVAVTRYLESYTVISTTHHTQLRVPVAHPYAHGVPVQMGAPMMAPPGYAPYTNPHQPMQQPVYGNSPAVHMAGAGGSVADMVSSILTWTQPGTPKNDTAPWANKNAEKSDSPVDNLSTIADEITALLLNLVIILDTAVPVQFNHKTLAALDVAAAELLVNMLTVKQALA